MSLESNKQVSWYDIETDQFRYGEFLCIHQVEMIEVPVKKDNSLKISENPATISLYFPEYSAVAYVKEGYSGKVFKVPAIKLEFRQ